MASLRKVYWSEADLRRRLRRVEGQIRGIEAMVGRVESCDDILMQLAATQGALAKVGKIVEACRLAEKFIGDDTDSGYSVESVQRIIREVVTGG